MRRFGDVKRPRNIEDELESMRLERRSRSFSSAAERAQGLVRDAPTIERHAPHLLARSR